MAGPVDGLADGQGPFLQRPGRLWLPQFQQDRGEVVQVGGDLGVVRPVDGLADGQRTFWSRRAASACPSFCRIPARLFSRVPTAGWPGL